MRFHHVAFTVDDLEESLDFYTKKLGFEVAGRFENEEADAEFGFVEKNDIRIELWDFTDQKEPEHGLDELEVRGARHLAIGVDSLQQKVSELEEKGLEFTEIKETATGEYYAFTADPSGIPLEFYGPM